MSADASRPPQSKEREKNQAAIPATKARSVVIYSDMKLLDEGAASGRLI